MRPNGSGRRNRRIEQLLVDYHQDDEVVFAEFFQERAEEDRRMEAEWGPDVGNEVIHDGK